MGLTLSISSAGLIGQDQPSQISSILDSPNLAMTQEMPEKGRISGTPQVYLLSQEQGDTGL